MSTTSATPATPPAPPQPSTGVPSALDPSLRDVLLRGEARLTRTREGVWVACFEMPTGLGPIQLCATVNERHIVPALVRFLEQRYGGGAVSGFSIERIGELARRIARGRVLRRLLASAREIIQDPRVAQAVGLASVVFPVVGPALGAATIAARAATTVIARAHQDPDTRRRLEQLARAATQGHPQARQALDILRAVAPAVRTAMQGGGAVAPAAAAAASALSPEAIAAVQRAVSGAPAPIPPSWTTWLPRRSDRQMGLAVLAQAAPPVFSTGR